MSSSLNKNKTVYVNVCSRRSPEWGAILKLQTAMQYASKYGISSTLSPRVGESLICRARNNSVFDFYNRKFDYLLTIDDDVEVCEDCIVKLIEANKGIVGGFYRLKDKEKASTAVRIWEPDDIKRLDFYKILKRNMLTKVEYVSTGCMLVKRSVITAMIAAYPDLHYTANVTRNRQWALYMPFIYKDEYLSEDWAFCQRARDIGFEIWADGSIKCAHWGLIKYDFEEEPV